MLGVNKYSLLKPDYIKSKGYKRSNLLKADEYKGHKLTRGWYNHLPLGNLIYEDKFNSDTYKLLNKGKDDRSWSKRNSNKLFLGKSTLGAGAIAGGIVAGSLAAPIAVPVGLAAGGVASNGHPGGALLGSGLGAATSLMSPSSMIGLGSGVASRFVGNDAKERLKNATKR